jgi:hypothetical protein
MINIALMVMVTGVVVLALAVDVGALVSWLRGRWR